MNRPNRDDISIDKDKWITCIALDHTQAILDIDAFLEPTISFWKYLETNCVSACCGIEAFALWPEDIKHAKQQMNDLHIKQKFEKLKYDLLEQSETQLISSYLNNLFHKTVFIQLINHIVTYL